MKRSIIYLGIALVAFTHVTLALDFQQSQNPEKDDVMSSETPESQFVITHRDETTTTDKKSEEPTIALEFIGPDPSEKTIEEVIAENNKIIEADTQVEGLSFSTDSQAVSEEMLSELEPVCSQKTTEQKIVEDAQITENALLTESQPITAGKCKKV